MVTSCGGFFNVEMTLYITVLLLELLGIQFNWEEKALYAWIWGTLEKYEFPEGTWVENNMSTFNRPHWKGEKKTKNNLTWSYKEGL